MKTAATPRAARHDDAFRTLFHTLYIIHITRLFITIYRRRRPPETMRTGGKGTLFNKNYSSFLPSYDIKAYLCKRKKRRRDVI